MCTWMALSGSDSVLETSAFGKRIRKRLRFAVKFEWLTCIVTVSLTEYDPNLHTIIHSCAYACIFVNMDMCYMCPIFRTYLSVSGFW